MNQRELFYVVPGSGDVFAEHYRRVLAAAASPGTTLSVTGVEMPEDQRDGALLPALPYYYGALFRTLKALDEKGAGGAIIGCSADPGLEDAKEFCRMPVVGPLESALTIARLHRWRVAVVVPGTPGECRQYRRLARQYGFDEVIATIEAVSLGYPGDAEMAAWGRDDPMRLREELLGCHAGFVEHRLGPLAVDLLSRSDANAVFLGCTLWTGMGPAAEERLGVPVIDPGLGALHLVEALAASRQQEPA